MTIAFSIKPVYKVASAFFEKIAVFLPAGPTVNSVQRPIIMTSYSKTYAVLRLKIKNIVSESVIRIIIGVMEVSEMIPMPGANTNYK